MSEKILYLLGAGASAEAMPLIKAIPNKPQSKSLSNAFNELAQLLTPNTPSSIIKKHTHEPFYRKIAEELQVLSKEGENFTTIDTYAKYLYIKDREKFNRLKFVMSVYFSLEQMHNKKLDKRYLVWMTSILENYVFPENIKVMTWNYDFQIELTAEKFRSENISHRNTITKYSPPLINYYPSLRDDMYVNPEDISLLHLNGIAGFYNKDSMNYHVFLDSEENKNGQYLDKLMENEGYSKLHFAWEKEFQDMPINIIKAMAKDATTLVIIGYSFPFFNRVMDMEVCRAINKFGKLKKIYFQDPVRNGDFLRSQFGYPDYVKIEHIPNVDALYIPFEL